MVNKMGTTRQHNKLKYLLMSYPGQPSKREFIKAEFGLLSLPAQHLSAKDTSGSHSGDTHAVPQEQDDVLGVSSRVELTHGGVQLFTAHFSPVLGF